MRLKVGDDFLDSDGSIIAQTYSVNEIGSIETRQGGFSNDFTIPLTSKNKALLDFPNNINSASRNPYSKVSATLFDKGTPVSDGFLKYQIVSDTSLQASFFGDNVNWFTLLKQDSIRDLDLSEFDHTWNASTIKTTIDANKTSDYIYPLIDYGTSNNVATSGQYSVFNFMPGFFIHTLVEKIFENIGWKIEGEIIDSTIYKRLIIPFSNTSFSHSVAWAENLDQTGTIGLQGPFGVSFTSFTPSSGAVLMGDFCKVILTVKLNITCLSTSELQVTSGLGAGS